MKWRVSRICGVAAGLAGALALTGCGGGGGNAANQVNVVVTGTSVLLPKQVETLTAIVSGATDQSSSFECTFTTTPDPTTATPNPKASDPKKCDDASVKGAVGTLSNIQNTSTTTNSTATFTAPDTFPDHATLPNVTVIITATSHANSKKTGTFNINFDSGVRITITPKTATLATGETKQFFAKDFNGNLLPAAQITWGVTFEASAKVDSVSCSGGSNDCGSVDANGNYTAPAKVPAAPTAASGGPPVNAAGIVTIFVLSKIDNRRIDQGSITVVAGGPITFSGISPITVPLGGPLADIFLNAPNVTSQVGVVLTRPDTSTKTIDPFSNQIKVVFAAGSSTSSIGARVRLGPADLTIPGTYQLQITPGGTATVTGGPFPFNVVRVAPSVITTFPDNFQESTLGQKTIDNPGLPQFSIDGGYFGSSVNPAATASFNGNQLLATSISPRTIVGNLPLPGGPPATGKAGLFPVSVTNSLAVPPLTAHTNVAVIPDYGGLNPPAAPTTISLGASSVPSAIAIDSILNIGALTLAGVNDPAGGSTNTQQNVQFFSVAGGTVSLLGTATSGGNVATSVAIDDQLHVAAVINYASRTLSFVNVPGGAAPFATVNLNNVIPPPSPAPATPFVQPFPYAVGVDPFLHRAIVAFASTNIGLIVNFDPAANVNCILDKTNATPPQYCVIGFVTLNTGANPQVAFEPASHIAYVTPGGGGLLEGVNLANLPSQPIAISKVARTANTVQVTTAQPHNLSSGVAPVGAPTVLISNVPPGTTNNTNFNGAFPITSVLGPNDFTYAQADKNDTSTCSSSNNCTMSQGSVNLAFLISPSVQGIAVNPITRRLVMADRNLSGSQITFLDAATRSFQSMSIFSGATGAVFTGQPEIGETNVGFQPFSNTAVLFNPSTGINQVSMIDPSLLQRAALVNTGQTGTGTASYPPGTSPTVTLTIPGALAVDAAGNQAIAVNSGSGSLSVIHLGNIKPVHIQELRTPDVPGTTLRHAAFTSPTAPLTTLGGVKIFGSGFDSTSQVRLDGTPLGSGVTFVNNHEIDLTITIPPALVGVPHRFAVDVVTGGVLSNTADFIVIGVTAVPDCSAGHALPGGVAIDEQRNLAVVTNTACAQVSLLSLNPASNFGQIIGSIPTGGTPTGVAVLPRLTPTLGLAVVTNNSSSSVSILDLDKQAQAAKDLTVGSNPTGVAINPQTNLAVIANTGSNSVSSVDLSPLGANPPGTLTVQGPVGVDQSPIAVAIDPDRGSGGRGLAVVTALQLNALSSATGVLDAIDIGGTAPARSTTAASASFLNTTPTGIVFDPAAATGTTNPGVFYGVTSQSNQVVVFNPDNGTVRPIAVGINPNSVALNFNSGTVLTVNASSNTISLLDAQTFQTKETIGIGGSGPLAAALHTLQNLAVIVDQSNNRVLLLPLP